MRDNLRDNPADGRHAEPEQKSIIYFFTAGTRLLALAGRAALQKKLTEILQVPNLLRIQRNICCCFAANVNQLISEVNNGGGNVFIMQ